MAMTVAAVEALESLGFARHRHRAPAHQVAQAEAPETPRCKNAWLRKVRTPEGKLYARRKVIEPVFGQIKEARGFRRFLLRGLENIRGAWRLVCLTHNLLKIWRYGSAQSAASCRREITQWA
jgi:hypothetical protein